MKKVILLVGDESILSLKQPTTWLVKERKAWN